jgi:hypothetical protein
MTNRYLALLCLLPSAALPACGAEANQSPAGGGGAAGLGTGGTTIPSGNGGASVGAGGSAAATGAVTGAGGVNVVGAGGMVPVGTGGAPIGAGGAVGAGGMPTTPGGDYEFKTGTFSVPPGGEVYKCQDFTNPFGKDVAVVQMDTALTQGSHHMFAFVMPNNQLTLKDSLVDCPSGGVEFHEYLTTTGSPQTTTAYPAGIGRVFAAGNGLRLNVHLINTDTAPKNAYITFKVKTVDPASLEQRVASIFLNQATVRVPTGMSTQTKSYAIPQEIWLMDTASHMHKRGIHFVAKAGTQTIYDGTEWAEPTPQTFNPPLHLPAQTSISWSCTYNNDSGGALSFGESASKNEMCILVGEFYNKGGAQITDQAIF